MDKLLRVYDKSGQVLGALPLSELKIDLGDGMLDSVDVQGDNLVFTFNTQAGKAPINVPIASVFNPESESTKNAIKAAVENMDILTEDSFANNDDVKDVLGL